MKKNVIVSLADSNYFELLNELVNSIIRFEKSKEINFRNVAYPMLFLPFVSRGSEIIGKRIVLKFDQKEFLLSFNQTIYSNNSDQLIIENTENLYLGFIENNNSFSEKDWQEIYKLSEKTFVEEKDSLKKHRAGAGLTDND